MILWPANVHQQDNRNESIEPLTFSRTRFKHKKHAHGVLLLLLQQATLNETPSQSSDLEDTLAVSSPIQKTK